MAFMTPRGLKIRLATPLAFSLVARLRDAAPKRDPFEVFRTCEAIERIPSVLAVIFGLAAVVLGYRALLERRMLWIIPAAIIVGRLIGLLLTHYGVFIVLKPLGLLRLALKWSRIPILPVLVVHLPLVVIFYVLFDWPVPAIWVLGSACAFFACSLVTLFLSMRISKATRMLLTSSEISFFHAYRLHAERLEITRDITLSKQEIKAESWKDVFREYSSRYPEAVINSAPGPKEPG